MLTVPDYISSQFMYDLLATACSGLCARDQYIELTAVTHICIAAPPAGVTRQNNESDQTDLDLILLIREVRPPSVFYRACLNDRIDQVREIASEPPVLQYTS